MFQQPPHDVRVRQYILGTGVNFGEQRTDSAQQKLRPPPQKIQIEQSLTVR